MLTQLTGLKNVYMEQVQAFSSVHRDPGERVISIAYYALLGPEEYDVDLLDQHSALWVRLEDIPHLGFDHPLMVERALDKIRGKLTTEPIGFKLLPELFTLFQMQTLFETILGSSIDKRNFRKRVIDTGCVVKTDLIDKTGSRRGASLYRFDARKYNSLTKFKI